MLLDKGTWRERKFVKDRFFEDDIFLKFHYQSQLLSLEVIRQGSNGADQREMGDDWCQYQHLQKINRSRFEENLSMILYCGGTI